MLRTGFAISFLAIIGPVGMASDSPLDRSDPAARTRCETLAASYAKLGSYRDHGHFLRTIRFAGRDRVEDTPLAWAFSRPNKIAIDAGEVRVRCDGKTFTTVLEPTKRFMSSQAEPTLSASTIADGPAGAVLLGGVTGPPSELMLKLLLAGPPANCLPSRCTSVKTEPDATIDGKPFPTLRMEMGDEPALRVVIDPSTNLIRRMEYVLDDKVTGDRIPKSAGELSTMSIAWEAGEISTAAPEADAFTYKPDAGFVRVKAAEAKPAAVAAKNEMIGKMAPEFELTVLDGTGKTRKITRDDLAGKVVILDFWATWCGPCLAELPEIQKLRESLAKSGKPVVIVAVSEDRKPEDAPVRFLVEATLKEKGIVIDDGKVGRIALDPEQATGDAFKIQALPTLVILDAKGIVQSVHVGFSEDIKDTLAAEIDSILEGKSPAVPDGPKPAPKPESR